MQTHIHTHIIMCCQKVIQTVIIAYVCISVQLSVSTTYYLFSGGVISKYYVYTLQIDSLWYYQGIKGGVRTWEAKSSVFPDGIAGLSQKTGGFIVAQNTFW